MGRAWARGSPAGSAARCSSWAATTPPSSRPSADLDLATRGIVFSAAGTAGQRCTTMRRVIAHRSVVDELTERLASAYDRLPIGNPMAEGTLVGPLIHARRLRRRMEQRPRPGRRGGRQASSPAAGGSWPRRRPNAYYVRPAIVRIDEQTPVVEQETFAPLLYVLPYDDFEEAIALNNAVPQGLSSSVFTTDQAEAELFVVRGGLRLRHRQRQHRHVRRRDRRRVRRREGDRRRPRVRVGRLARLHAPGHQHRQLLRRAPARPGRGLHRLSRAGTAPGPGRSTISASPSSTSRQRGRAGRSCRRW